MNSLWKEKELEYAIRDSGVKVLCCDADRLRYAMPTLTADGVFAVTVRDQSPPSHPLISSMDSLLGSGAAYGAMPYFLDGKEEDAANIMYTSGTTGNPKGVVQTNRGVCDQILMVRAPLPPRPFLRRCHVMNASTRYEMAYV